MKYPIQLKVNGVIYDVEVTPRKMLLEVLRSNLGLTGTKRGCEEGNCGACTVLINGRPVNSCLVLAVEAQGKDIQTIEGLARDGELHPLQKAFVQFGFTQCGFCNPGMLMAAKGLLEYNPHPSRQEVIKAIAGNLCRCTGYLRAVDAILAVSRGEV